MNDEVTISVSPRDATISTSWTETGSVAFQAGYDAQPGIPASTPEQFALTQDKYTISSVVAATPVAFNAVQLTVTTNAPVFKLSLRIGSSTGEEIGSLNNASGINHSVPLLTFEGSGTRTVYVVNPHTGISHTTFDQPALPKYRVYGPVQISHPYSNVPNLCPSGYTRVNYAPVGETLVKADGTIYNYTSAQITVNMTTSSYTYYGHTVKNGVVQSYYYGTSDMTYSTQILSHSCLCRRD
jgi:hypothetical protein